MTPDDMARIYAAAFPNSRPWSAEEIAGQICAPGFACHAPGGFAIGRSLGDDAELITLAVDPIAQRRGIGRQVLQQFEQTAAARGAIRGILEVAQDNLPAIALYDSFGWQEIGQRPRYYARTDGTRVSALIYNKQLVNN